jgi:methylenetetrahydrofolate dehydrogenase (NADP+)/methenyltetrahydrofolate cyclohydrolase
MIIDGRTVAAKIEEEIKKDVEELKKKGVEVAIAPVLVGSDPGAKVYYRTKQKQAERLGIKFKGVELPDDTTESQLIKVLEDLGKDPGVHGIFIELPLPKQIDLQKVAEAIPPEKDIDCLNPKNLGKLIAGGAVGATFSELRKRLDFMLPTTPQAVMELILAYQIPAAGKEVVVVGRGAVGLPLAVLLLREGFSPVTVVRGASPTLGEITRRADVLCTCVGRAHLVKGDMIKKGAYVLDVGINPTPDGKIVGDVDFESAKEVAAGITPVPGGVGPVTTALIFAHTVQAAKYLSQ